MALHGGCLSLSGSTLSLTDSDVERFQQILSYEADRIGKGDLTRLSGKDLSTLGVSENELYRLLEKGILVEPVKGEYTTPHAELMRKLVNLSLNPNTTLTFEWLLLRRSGTPLPSFKSHQIDKLIGSFTEFLVKRGIQRELSRKISISLIKGLKKAGIHNLSNYQYEMIERILTEKWPLIPVISAPTGSGKTLIFVIVALVHATAERFLGSREPSTLFIYPRKALARDQLHKLAAIIYHINSEFKRNNITDKNGKPLRLTLGILDGDTPRNDNNKIINHIIRGISFQAGLPIECRYVLRGSKLTSVCESKDGSEVLYKLINDVREEIVDSPPSILISNKYMIDFHINPLNKTRKFARVFTTPSLIVIDEAHAYSGLEKVLLANLIHQLFLEKTEGKIDNLKASAYKHAVILSSATITTAHLNKKIKKHENKYDIYMRDIRRFVSFLVPHVISSKFRSWRQGEPIISVIYEFVEKDKGPRRLEIVLALMPRPSIAASTVMQEAILATLTWSLANRYSKFSKKMKFISFFDNKDDLERINEWLRDIIIRGRCEHCDRLGVPEEKVDMGNVTCPGNNINIMIKEEWKSYIARLLEDDNIKLKTEYYDFNKLTKLSNDHKLWVSLAAIINEKDASKKILKLIKETCKYTNYVSVHHAELNRELRGKIEEKFGKGDLLGLLSTQTLELGIDISDVSVILQYKPPRKAENFVQRLGRAGRSIQSLYTSLGVLVLSQIDTPYLNRDFAEKALFEVRPKPPPYKNFNLLAYLLLRYSLLLANLEKDEEFLKYMSELTSFLEATPNTTYYSITQGNFERVIIKIINKIERYKDKTQEFMRELMDDNINSETINTVYNIIIKELKNLINIGISDEENEIIKTKLEEARSYVEKIFSKYEEIINKNKKEDYRIILDILKGLEENILKIIRDLQQNREICWLRGSNYIRSCNIIDEFKEEVENIDDIDIILINIIKRSRNINDICRDLIYLSIFLREALKVSKQDLSFLYKLRTNLNCTKDSSEVVVG